MATLQERMDEFKKSFDSGAPPYNAPHHAIETMHRATAELKANGLEDRRPCSGLHLIQPGSRAGVVGGSPTSRTPGRQLLPRPLVTLLQHGELEALQQIYPEVRALGAQIVVLTPELEHYTPALHK